MGISFERLSKWMEGSGPHADIIISSRIRLARNLKGMPFPHLMDTRQESRVVQLVGRAVQSAGVERAVGPLYLQRLRELTPLERQILVEKHLISPQLAEDKGEKAVVLREDEAISIMVNEEDHLRLQCLLPALMLHEGWRMATSLDDALEEELDYAFDQERGYLTACPTNVGTGLRASVMVHLPALVISKQAGQVLSALTKVGLAVRGLYGEGTEAAGNLFQISNQITLGRTEEELINNLSAVAVQLADQERGAREHLYKKSRWQLEDRVGRAYGILSNARILNSQEALRLLSDVRLGVEMKIIRGIDQRVINQLMFMIQPAYLQYLAGREMPPHERDVQRARLVRERLQGKIS
ncbi:MAG: protein arginine kinase [Thermanaeromonas sp.]|uniref:protein arginine kinase n=1 Tax=Thermanaeromonas sp. TaxID=2003697 RepID=UPI002440A8FD|nr:protein arginine kinase [Thermanaeromonas sp.]MCG0278249.1 protein arginine kinase [Thermanaeromonas sp.]